jgi:hypothetical protein
VGFDMKIDLTSDLINWLVVIASSALLLWGISLAINNLINGTSVVS